MSEINLTTSICISLSGESWRLWPDCPTSVVDSVNRGVTAALVSVLNEAIKEHGPRAGDDPDCARECFLSSWRVLARYPEHGGCQPECRMVLEEVVRLLLPAATAGWSEGDASVAVEEAAAALAAMKE